MSAGNDGTPEKITAADIVELLKKKFAGNEYVYATEVGDSTGAACGRHVDFMAMDLWPSNGYKIGAYEIKVSRADLRRELEHPEKHNCFFDNIDTFTLVCPKKIVDLSILPPKWGVLAVEDGKLRTVRKPLAMRDDHKSGLSHGFFASFLRKAVHEAVADESRELRERFDEVSVQRRIKEAYDRGFAAGKSDALGMDEDKSVTISKFRYDEYMWMSEFCHRLHIYHKSTADSLASGLYAAQNALHDMSTSRIRIESAKKALQELEDTLYGDSVRTIQDFVPPAVAAESPHPPPNEMGPLPWERVVPHGSSLSAMIDPSASTEGKEA